MGVKQGIRIKGKELALVNKCGTNIYFFTLQRFGSSPSPNFRSFFNSLNSILEHSYLMDNFEVKERTKTTFIPELLRFSLY